MGSYYVDLMWHIISGDIVIEMWSIGHILIWAAFSSYHIICMVYLLYMICAFSQEKHFVSSWYVRVSKYNICLSGLKVQLYICVLSICSWGYCVEVSDLSVGDHLPDPGVGATAKGLTRCIGKTNIDLGVTATPISRVFVDAKTQNNYFHLYSYLIWFDDCSRRKYICI